jgi:hypothetical protein
VLLLVFFISSAAHAQSAEYSCKYIPYLHQTLDCIEAIFSEDPVHLTFGSVPPGNGVALGVVWERPTHFVSAFAPQVIPDMRDRVIFPDPVDPDTKAKVDRGGYKSLFVPRLGAAVSTNGSWYVNGSADWLPGIYTNGIRTLKPLKPGLPARKKTCHEFSIFCTESVLTIHSEGTHRVARTINFYGLGPGSPPTKFIFRQDDTYGGIQARFPLTNILILVAGIEGRAPELPFETKANSVFSNFTSSALPGLNPTPLYVHSNVGIILQARHVSEAVTEETDTPNEKLPLLKHRTAISAREDFAYHWYSDASSSKSSFEQLTAGAALSVELGAVTQKYVVSTDVSGFFPRTFYRLLEHYCGGPPVDPRIVVDRTASAKERDDERKRQEEQRKQNRIAFEIKHDDYCDFGTLNFRSYLVTSTALSGNIIPFYMLPTVGGQDIESRISLRGFDNYRFRGPDATFLQAEYSVPVYGPLALLLFYDTGNTGNSLGDLSFAHLRQDAGFGVDVRIMRKSVAQLYLAAGRGGGFHPGFNLTKQF